MCCHEPFSCIQLTRPLHQLWVATSFQPEMCVEYGGDFDRGGDAEPGRASSVLDLLSKPVAHRPIPRATADSSAASGTSGESFARRVNRSNPADPPAGAGRRCRRDPVAAPPPPHSRNRRFAASKPCFGSGVGSAAFPAPPSSAVSSSCGYSYTTFSGSGSGSGSGSLLSAVCVRG